MRWEQRWVWLASLTVGLLAVPLGADQGSESDKKVFEKNLDAGLREVINYGATIFNTQSDYAGCYHVFEGSLKSIKPVLAGYPELQKKIETALTQANQLPSMHDRAHALRKVLEEVRHTINPSLPREVAKQPETDKKALVPKKEDPGEANLARAKGVVKIGGQLLTHGFVTFVNTAGQKYSANLQKDGTFVFRKGFPPGAYVVLIEDPTSPAGPGEKRIAIPTKYSDASKAQLRVTAAKGDNVFDLDLTAK